MANIFLGLKAKMIKNISRKPVKDQHVRDMKVKKNAYILASIFWIAASMFIYARDVGFSDVYSWKPFVFFIVGPIVAAIVFGNILFTLQKIVEKFAILLLADTKPHMIAPLVSSVFYMLLIGTFLVIFEFAKLVQSILT